MKQIEGIATAIGMRGIGTVQPIVTEGIEIEIGSTGTVGGIEKGKGIHCLLLHRIGSRESILVEK